MYKMKDKYALIIDDELEEPFEATPLEALKKFADEVKENEEDNLHFTIELVKLESLQSYKIKIGE